MAIERTFSIIKLDAVEKNTIGGVLKIIEGAGLKVKATRMIHLSRSAAESFYGIHKERPFFGELVEFMTRGPVVISVLEGENAVAKYRESMGATNPASAAEGTIRKAYGGSVGENAVHGSDSLENATNEIAFFFPGYEIF